MDTVVIRAPLLGWHDTIDLPAPCTYCGKPAEPPAFVWEQKNVYNLKHWAHGAKHGTMQLWDLMINGVKQKGDVTVRAPYCDQHAGGIKIFDIVRAGSLIIMLIASVFALIGIYSAPGEHMFDEPQDFFILVGTPLLLVCLCGTAIAWVICSLIALVKPEFRNFPIWSSGHWGLTVFQQTDGGKFAVGPVTYWVSLRFHSVESAKRFLAAYPRAEVTKGEGFISD